MASNKCFAITVLIISLILLYADHNLLSPNLTEISKEFNMTTEERDLRLGGQISLSFYLVGIPSSIIFGWLTDMIEHRSKLFAVAVMIGEIACFATYFVRSFEMLLLTRTLTGIGIGASLPVVYSILGDFYEAQGRNIASAIVSTATGVGLGVGQGLAGFVGPTYGWRFPFLIVSLPAFFTAVICLICVEDPERGNKESTMISLLKNHHETIEASEDGRPSSLHVNQSSIQESKLTILEEGNLPQSLVEPIECKQHEINDDVQYNKWLYPVEKPSIRTTLLLIKTPTIILILIQGIPSVIPLGIASTFLNDYLSQEKGLSVEAATAVLLTFGVGNTIGVLVGGYVGHLLYKIDPRYPSLAMGIGVMLSSVPMWFIIHMDYRGDAQVIKASIVMMLSGFFAVFPLPIERAILNNVSLPERRGRANSFLSVIDNIGKAFGPYLLSLMTATIGRQEAYSYSLIGWIVGGCLCLLIFCSVKQDEDANQQQISVKLTTNAS